MQDRDPASLAVTGAACVPRLRVLLERCTGTWQGDRRDCRIAGTPPSGPSGGRAKPTCHRRPAFCVSY